VLFWFFRLPGAVLPFFSGKHVAAQKKQGTFHFITWLKQAFAVGAFRTGGFLTVNHRIPPAIQ